MALTCERHTAALFDRGGERKMVDLAPLTRVRYERLRDDTSQATVNIGVPSAKCAEALALADAGRAELVIFRGGERVWEGPNTLNTYTGGGVELQARDITHYMNRTAMHNEYDNRYPNNGKVLDRLKRIFTAELARKEALDPPVNILEHIQYIYATAPGVDDAGTAAHTLPYEMSVFAHLDSYAARGGLDYTVIGRSLILHDVHQKLGQTPMVSNDDFIGDPIITQYGMELATRVIMTDGKGNAGIYGGPNDGIDPHYGEWELLHQAYDESAQNPMDPDAPPTVAELESQAKRTYSQGKYPPLVVRVPDNTSLNPNGVLTMADLVPGVWIPVQATLPGRSLTQMQKLDKMTVEETPENGETIKVVLSPAPSETQTEAQ